MDQTLERFLFLFLGWILGLSSPIIVDTLKRRRENREVRAALRIELMELEYRLASAVYMIEIRFGTMSKELLGWLRPIAANYKGLNPSENLLMIIDKSCSPYRMPNLA